MLNAEEWPNFISIKDDFHLRVFNYNTSARVAAFEAHPDYIRLVIGQFNRLLRVGLAFSVG